ncbi:hypothetical protein CVS29_07520 [Arthrobacter psychrochitiniphilus]|uniref:Uncharacterized protein n=1 Tax=Arthrobacter psychrochitiniphilus TaxID=291045 RepID=A0A2V3DYK9_9MICC|nr:hypothetical protein CVS29_07520 [Arthrobacter psychrochitiniphilus]
MVLFAVRKSAAGFSASWLGKQPDVKSIAHTAAFGPDESKHHPNGCMGKGAGFRQAVNPAPKPGTLYLVPIAV